MPLMTEVRDAACAHLKSALPNALRVEAFGGVLDFDRVAPKGVQYADRASLFIAPGECRNLGRDLRFDCEADFWVFAVARHASRPTLASNASLNLVQQAALAIHGQTFGLYGVAPAFVRVISALSGEELEKAGIWIWELCFGMRLTFGGEAA